jgi:hypothetical protein
MLCAGSRDDTTPRLAFATLLLLATLGQAQLCKPVDSTFDAFGVAQVGPKSLEFMDAHAARTKRCFFGLVASCFFVDWNGVLYDWLEGTIESKRAEFSSLRKGYSLPFGVTAADTPAVVKARLATHGVALMSTADPLKMFVAKMAAKGLRIPLPANRDREKAHHYWLTSDLCLRRSGGIVFSATFEFDPHDHLIAFETNAKTGLD